MLKVQGKKASRIAMTTLKWGDRTLGYISGPPNQEEAKHRVERGTLWPSGNYGLGGTEDGTS